MKLNEVLNELGTLNEYISNIFIIGKPKTPNHCRTIKNKLNKILEKLNTVDLEKPELQELLSSSIYFVNSSIYKEWAELQLWAAMNDWERISNLPLKQRSTKEALTMLDTAHKKSAAVLQQYTFWLFKFYGQLSTLNTLEQQAEKGGDISNGLIMSLLTRLFRRIFKK